MNDFKDELDDRTKRAFVIRSRAMDKTRALYELRLVIDSANYIYPPLLVKEDVKRFQEILDETIKKFIDIRGLNS